MNTGVDKYRVAFIPSSTGHAYVETVPVVLELLVPEVPEVVADGEDDDPVLVLPVDDGG